MADLRRTGDDVFARFGVSREQTLVYYRFLVTNSRKNPATNPDLLGELDRVVTEMETVAAPRTNGTFAAW